MIKSKYKNICIILIKILFISASVISIYKTVGHKGEIMDAYSFTTIGLNAFITKSGTVGSSGINAFYYIDYNMQVKLNSFKIICLTVLILMNYGITLFKIHNFYEGLKETIRIRSKNLNQYIGKSSIFYFKYIVTDVLVTIATIYIVMLAMNVKDVFNLQIVVNLSLMALFYIVVPFLIMFIVDRFEYFIVAVLLLTVFAEYFVYKLNIYNIILLYAIVVLITYCLILIRERNK